MVRDLTEFVQNPVARPDRAVLVISQAIPVFALAPILVLWLGYGITSKVAMATLDIFRSTVGAAALGLWNQKDIRR